MLEAMAKLNATCKHVLCNQEILRGLHPAKLFFVELCLVAILWVE